MEYFDNKIINLRNKIIKKNTSNSYNLGSYEFKLNSLEKKSNKCFFSGYASIFDMIDYQNDIIAPGAFSNTIKNCNKIILLWQHDHNQPIGKINNLKEDEKGLFVYGELVLDILKALDVYHMLKNDILDSFSIGYTPTKFSYKSNKKYDNKVRLINELKLWEISLVTFPANNFAKINNIAYDSIFENEYDKNYSNIDNIFFDNNPKTSLDLSKNIETDRYLIKKIRSMINKFNIKNN